MPDQEAGSAPLRPAGQGGIAHANAPNTLYAHVWNLGKAPAWRARVEFWWCDPSIGISAGDGHLVGAATIDLGNRFSTLPAWRVVDGPTGPYYSRGSHAIIRCPNTWVPRYVNGGHECLVVRVTEPFLDALSPTMFSSAKDRRVAQRNIAVVPSASPAAIDLNLSLGRLEAPAEVEIEVEMDAPASMEWLKLYTGKAIPRLVVPRAKVLAGVMPAVASGARVQTVRDVPFEHREVLLTRRDRLWRGCDALAVPLHASAEDLKRGEVQVVRVRQRLAGDVIGGYSIVLIGR